VQFSNAVTFDLTELFAGENPPKAGDDITLLEAGSIEGTSASATVKVVGCPYGYDVMYTSSSIVLKTKTAEENACSSVKIWPVGGNTIYGGTPALRTELAHALAAHGWNVEMTGFRTVNTPRLSTGFAVSKKEWLNHTGVQNLALKTSSTRAGFLEGLETYALAANRPDFTVFACGEIDVADGVADEKILANYKEAVLRIKAALPMTTVIACSIPGASDELNSAIAQWCASEENVEYVSISNDVIADTVAVKEKLLSLATAQGKNNPSTWTPNEVKLGAKNNVPQEYLNGFLHARTFDIPHSTALNQNLSSVKYLYSPILPKNGIVKAGYFIDLVHKSGDHMALWVDMDAPGSTLDDILIPTTFNQKKQMAVTKLHVWSNSRAVTKVPFDDDSVDGFIEFTPGNYSGKTASVAGSIPEPWSGDICGFTDTLSADGSHACFQIMRKFSDPNAFPAGEILFVWNHWGKGDLRQGAIGIGTFADYGNLGYSTSKTLDRTFTYGTGDVQKIDAEGYLVRRIEFWVKYSDDVQNLPAADSVWSGATDNSFSSAGNYLDGEATATTLAHKTILLPEDKSVSFTYPGYNPVVLDTTSFVLDGTALFNDVGGLYLKTLSIEEKGKLVLDPVKFSLRLVSPPSFKSGGRFALPEK
jgi:hypothetical protein